MTEFRKEAVKKCLDECDLKSLFTQELGWEKYDTPQEITLSEGTYILEPAAHKRGVVAYQCIAESEDIFFDRSLRQKIERKLAKIVREHIIIFITHDKSSQWWHWVKREPGQPDRPRQIHYHREIQSGEILIEKLSAITFSLDEEDKIGIADVNARVRAAFDVEKVTRKFYDCFRKEHSAFLKFITGLKAQADKEWYASLMLNRMMFIYFIQKRGFLDGDTDYLKKRLQLMQEKHGKDRFQNFYRLFLLRLFHEGLGQPESEREPELVELLGKVPYLNGGLFDVHELERDNEDIAIPDEAFDRIFRFFDAYQWHLDDRYLHNDNEINPDVLGYIFEKYINQKERQKETGAYYTKEDITGYISRNAILPFLFTEAKKADPVAFESGGGVWRLLQDDPDGYFWNSARHGITYDMHADEEIEKQELPPEIAAGINDVSKRGEWNKPAPANYALPTETWREHISRRQHYEKARKKVATGEIASINELITLNLNIEKFTLDVIANSEGPDLVRAFWKAIQKVSVLDPACGSGAFLFAALNILQPIYETCIESMQGLLDDLEKSERKHHPKKMSDFRSVIGQMREHASQPYFILKSIIINNLYGVDIMDEAVEICKLRLFLKLVAQLKDYREIEPLPDIDFNIRSGNSLVGFSSIHEVENTLSADIAAKASLPEINEDAELADRAFNQFRMMQTERGMDSQAFINSKSELRRRLDALRNRLNVYLAPEYGINLDKPKQRANWLEKYKPFHWFVEFYGIMSSGGFDVVIGNPPYIVYSKNKFDYTVSGYETQKCANLYAYFCEKSYNLLSADGMFGMILPSSSISADKMRPLQEFFIKNHHLWVSNFSWRPSKLFEGAEMLLAIIITLPSKEQDSHASKYHKWYKPYRPSLMESIHYNNTAKVLQPGSIPKIPSSLYFGIYEKMSKASNNVILSQGFSINATKHYFYYFRAVQYWVKSLCEEPYYKKDGKSESTSEMKKIHVATAQEKFIYSAILSSTLYFVHYITWASCQVINARDFEFPLDINSLDVALKNKLANLGKNLQSDYMKNSKVMTRSYAKKGKTFEMAKQHFYIKNSKPIIDEIDAALASHYGLDDEELDFIINYDIKYRTSADADE